MNVKKATLLVIMLMTLPHIFAQGTPKQWFLSNNSNKLFHWFYYNHLKANPGKWDSLLSSKTPIDVSIGDALLKTSTKETFFGILIDSELSFNRHVSSICSKASKKLHALGCIATFMSFKKCRTLMKAFIEFQFNYCPLIWMFQSRVILIRPPLLTNYLQNDW